MKNPMIIRRPVPYLSNRSAMILRGISHPTHIPNVIRLYRLGNNLKLIYLKQKAQGGQSRTSANPGTSANNAGIAKLEESLRRSRRTLAEYVACNKFTRFITVTGDTKKVNRFDILWIKKQLTRWLRYYRTKHNLNLEYIIIPERHENDSWHAHILIIGLPDEHLTPTNGSDIFTWNACCEKFGYTETTPIFDSENLVRYVTKCWHPENDKHLEELGKRLYYPSHGLKKRKLLAEWHCKFDTQDATNAILPHDFDFLNDHCAIQECEIWYADHIFRVMKRHCDRGWAKEAYLSTKVDLLEDEIASMKYATHKS